MNRVYGDYEILKFEYKKDGKSYYSVRCKICSHFKIIDSTNIKKQNMQHSKRNCKYDYYKNMIGNTIGDYKIIEVTKEAPYKITVVCNICGNKKIIDAFNIKEYNHSPSICKTSFYNNEIGKTYGDYRLLSINRIFKGVVYYNVQCTKCKTYGVKSFLSLKKNNFKHGKECFKMLNGKYKKEFSTRFNNINRRCSGKYYDKNKYYVLNNVKNEYEYLIDFYNDFIDEFSKHAKVYGVRNTTFDRIDVKGNYCKSNIRVTTQSVQSVNTNRKIFFILKNKDITVLSDNSMEFGRVYNVNGRSIGNVVRGKSKSCSGWTLVKKSKDIKDLSDINVTTKLITS